MRVSRHWLAIGIVVVLLGIGLPLKALSASDASIVISVAVPDYMQDTFTPDLFTEFKSANSGVKVNIVKSGQEANYPPAAFGIDEHLKGAAKYAASADVLYITNDELSPQTTHAGYFLDLTPFTQADRSVNADDFIPGTFRAFQWDGGVWALPVSVNINLLVYDAEAFDKAGVPHPDAKWTLNDLSNAATRLTQKDSDGKVTLPGMIVYDNSALLYALSGAKFYDDSVQPALPRFATPTYTALLDTLVKLYKSGSVSDQYRSDGQKVPLRFEGIYALANNIPNQPAMSAALLPGSKALLNVYGFAISQGTQYPDQAYALAKFLTNSTRLAGSGFFGDRPARKSLMNVNVTNTPYIPLKFAPEIQTIIEQAFANGISPSDLLFSDYIRSAFSKMRSDNIDAQTALQAAESDAIKDLETADARKGIQQVAVATPAPTSVLSVGQISIHFNLQANISPLPNKDAWDKVVQDFVANDPQVKQIVFDTGFNHSPTDNFDCFFTPYNHVAATDAKDLLNLDPYFDTDTTFAKDDVLAGAFRQLQKDNKTYGYPLVIQPEVLFYNANVFAKANVPIPQNDWTIDSFVDALRALKPSGSDLVPFAKHISFGSSSDSAILMLIAAYGGLPIDLRTDPPTISFTDAVNSTAIRQVLDLAKHGYLKYTALAGIDTYDNTNDAPIYSGALNVFSYRNFEPDSSTNKDIYKVVSFPRGSKFNVVAYTIGAAYISVKAAHPDACYRWFQTLAKHVALFSAMPARSSQIADSVLAATQDSALVAYYKDVDVLLKNPKTVVLPGGFNGSSVGGYVVQYFLDRAFDHYVLKNADLDIELADAQTYAIAYQGCIATIPPMNSSDPSTYYKQSTDCAVKIDPSLKALFGPG